MRFFCEDITSSKTASFTFINHSTINKCFNIFRLKMADFTFEGSLFSGEIESGEYFTMDPIVFVQKEGVVWLKKRLYFGVLKRDGNWLMCR
jgi:hypothetical protein